MLEERACRLTGRQVGEEGGHQLGWQLSTQLWGVDNPIELLQHVGGVLSKKLSLEGLVGVGQGVRCLQDVLELGQG